MSNPLQLPQPDMRPGGYIPPGPVQPDPISQMLQTFLQFREQSQQGRTADAQIEEAKQRTAVAQGTLKLEQEKQKTQQALIEQQAAETDSRGKAVQAFLKAAQPAIEQHLSTHPEVVQGLMGGQGGGSPLAMGGQGSGPPMAQGGSPLAMPVQQPIAAPTAPQPPPETIPSWGQLVQTMSPAAAAAFVHEDLPNLLKYQESLTGGGNAQAIQTGDAVTTYVPGKGFYDPSTGLPPSDPKAWKAAIERKMQPDELQLKKLNLALQQERLGAMQDYRMATRAQTMTRSFVTTTRPVRDRGMIINQAIQTIGDAQNNPDPKMRAVLTTSAIANFVQAADQKAQLRFQLLNYFKNNIDQSVAGRWDLLKTRMLQGTLPKYTTQGMLNHLQNLLQMSKSEYDKQRAGEIKRHPELGNWLPEADEYFSAEHPGGASSDPNILAPPP